MSAMQKQIALIEHLAKEAFAHHEVEVLLNQGVHRCWRVGRPNSSMYSSIVTTIPGSIVVVGDVGDLIVTRLYDMIPWCRRAMSDIGYFAQKVPASIPTREFNDDAARESVAAYFASLAPASDKTDEGDEEVGEEIEEDEDSRVTRQLQQKDLFRAADDGEAAFFNCLNDCGICPSELSSCQVYTANFLWCREVIRFLLDHFPEACEYRGPNPPD